MSYDSIVSLFGAVTLLFVAYKLIDWLLRLPTVGRTADRCVLITGCSSGFGRDLTRRLDSRGCHVFATCLNEQDAADLANMCSGRLRTLIVDVAQPESVRQAYRNVKKQLDEDGKELWALVNNAGISVSFGPVQWHSIDDYRDVADVNLYGLIDVTMTFLPLIKQSRGRVVNISSVGGRFSSPGFASYVVSKYGVEAFTDGLRRSLRPYGCKAILIEPGIYITSLASTESFRTAVQHAWNGLPAHLKEAFGEVYFQYYLETYVPEMVRMLGSDRIHEVTDAYEHAILGRYPRARYLVGRQCSTLWMPIQRLPEWLGDWILERLESGTPLPAELLNRNR